MTNYISRFSRGARKALAVGLVAALPACSYLGITEEKEDKPKDRRPRIDYPIVDSTTIDGFVVQKLRERGNDDRIINKYIEDRAKKELVLVTVGNTVDVVYGEKTSLAKVAVGGDGKPAGPFDPTRQLIKYEYGGSDIAEAVKGTAKTAGSAITTAVKDTYTYLKTGAQRSEGIWKKPCKIGRVLGDDDSNRAFMATRFPVNFNKTLIVPIETDCEGKKVFAGLMYNTAESLNEISKGISDGTISQIEFQDSTPWVYARFGDTFVFSPPGFFGVR